MKRPLLLLMVTLLTAASGIGWMMFEHYRQEKQLAEGFTFFFEFDPRAVPASQHQKAQAIVSCIISNIWQDVVKQPPPLTSDPQDIRAIANEIGITSARVAMFQAQVWMYDSVPLTRGQILQNRWRSPEHQWLCPRF